MPCWAYFLQARKLSTCPHLVLILLDETVGILVGKVFELDKNVLTKRRHASLHKFIDKIIVSGSWINGSELRSYE